MREQRPEYRPQARQAERGRDHGQREKTPFMNLRSAAIHTEDSARRSSRRSIACAAR